MTTLLDLIETARGDAELFGAGGACPALFEEGGNPRVLLVSGANAGGKSLLCRYLDSISEDPEGRRIEFMRVGMGLRTQHGMHRAFMFGEEDRDSTGCISARAVKGGLNTCNGRGKPHFLCLDEPDVGLSEEMQWGLGDKLARFAASMPDETLGLVVVSHSRPLAECLLPLSPWCARVGDDLRPTREWVAAPVRRATAEDFDSLSGVAAARTRAVAAVINPRAEARRAERSSGPRR